ncbi:MAG: translation initiation factor IF-2 [Phycisphaeraceae bacterium]|nr:translation initiation factor IF-2 [Phycisphaeraceae bacterium]
MAKAKRVFEVAKELGVTSKAIIDKCKAEGVPGITNHMSVVKVGLVVTIGEWFSTQHDTSSTAVETAEKVDLDKVRIPRRRAARKHGGEEPTTADGAATAEEDPEVIESPVLAAEPGEGMDMDMSADSAVMVEEPEAPAVDEPATESAPRQGETIAETLSAEVAEVEGSAIPAPTAHVAAQAPAQPAVVPPSAAPAHAPARATRPRADGSIAQPNVPERPAIVKPMGEQLKKPQQAVLKGPRVVRIEAPEQTPAPRARRPAPSGGSPMGGGNSMDPAVPGITRSRGPVRGRGAGPQVDPGAQDTPAKGGKRRSLSTRRGRSADAMPLGPGKISEQDLIELDARLKGAPGYLKQRRRTLRKSGNSQQAATPVQTGGKVEIAEPITIKGLSSATGIKTADIIKYLFSKGIMATINSAIDSEAAMEVALEHNIELVVREQQTAEEVVIGEFDAQEEIDVRKRPPVVTILGHVDHGKTSLLDRIRKSDVAAHEDGGITQHVGAYRVTVAGSDGTDKTVVFLDTPGHEAFTSMRSRGANLTDLVVLVVAADDGVMPQTVESINHAKAAEVPIIVALNKIDKQEATEGNLHKIFGQLAEHGLNPTEWGGETEIIKTSATSGRGVTDLLEILDYQAELLDLKSDYGGPARGTVIEAEMQEGRGPVARVLVQQGTLRLGDFIVIGRAFGRVRDMTDDRGRNLAEAGPATPLELSGIDMIPDAGDKFYITGTYQKAEEIASQFRERERQKQLATQTKLTLDNFAAQLKAGQTRELRVVLKADVQGSVDVLRKQLSEVGNDEVAVKVLHAAVGGITESDVVLADASDAIILGFHVVAPSLVRDIAESRHVDIRTYRVIYDLVDDVKAGLEGLLAPETREQELGAAEVRQVFKVSKVGTIAGCLVVEGTVQRGAKVRVVRDNVVVTDNREIDTLRRVKDDAREVRMGTECGIRITGFDDIKPGDRLVCYQRQTVARKLV